MMTVDRIQALIHKLEVEAGARWLNYLAVTLGVLALAVWYDTHCYHSFNAPQAMDAAQVGRNLAQGKGFSTECIRPFSIYLLQKHNQTGATAAPGDAARLNGPHPDLANAPLYPTLLAGLFKVTSPRWPLELKKPFWGSDGHFARYQPEFVIALLNQFLFGVAVFITFRLARSILDGTAAWISAVLMLGADQLWKFSVSGLPTMLLLVIFLGLAWALVAFETTDATNESKRQRLAALAGFLAGLGTLTLYGFGWVIIPLVLYFIFFGDSRRVPLALSAVLAFAVVIGPWIARNLAVSGTFFGTAGYAILEGSVRFPDTELMQSLNPNLSGVFGMTPYVIKLLTGLRGLLQTGVPGLGGGWIGCFFLAGLLLGLRNVALRRLRYFAMMCLGVFLVVSALGGTPMGAAAPETNAEDLLVLLTPLAIILGTVFFLTLLDQMNLELPPLRYGIIVVVILLLCQQFIFTLLPPKGQLTAFPQYSPADLQRIDEWIKPNEMMMSDLPWAVAWYGDRSCSWTTLDSGAQFSQFNASAKHVSGLYLSQQILDSKLMDECMARGRYSWAAFVYERVGVRPLKADDPEDTWTVFFRMNAAEPRQNFPLEGAAPSEFSAGMFLADHPRD